MTENATGPLVFFSRAEMARLLPRGLSRGLGDRIAIITAGPDSGPSHGTVLGDDRSLSPRRCEPFIAGAAAEERYHPAGARLAVALDTGPLLGLLEVVLNGRRSGPGTADETAALIET